MTDKWISTADRQPPSPMYSEVDVELYLVVQRGHFVTLGQWYKKVKEWKIGSYFVTKEVTHWMPLPRPPAS